MRIHHGVTAAIVFVLHVPAREPVAGTCEELSKLALPHTTITLAQAVEAGGFTPPGANGRSTQALPAFCRVTATLAPSTDSDIKIEVWLPASGWNGKYQAVGNGAFSGAIGYAAMSSALARGYATSSTDTGHTGGSGSFALGHPEKAIDFGWRAVHEMTEVSKTIIAAYYASAPKHWYWNGCSAGGRQAMMEAQRFPADFDGIIAGSPGLDWTGRAAQAVRIASLVERDEAARLLQPQRELLHRAVVAACDSLDGMKDGVLDNPARCTFDPAILECNGADTAGCLTASQVNTARAIYASPENPRTHRQITGLLPGSELGWTDLGWTGSAWATGLDQFRYLIFGDPAWTIQQFSFDHDIVRAEEVDAGALNALDPNLKPFIDRGGRMIQYHGWSDPQISPASSPQYYTRVLERLGGEAAVQGAYRLFMAPGMGHCSGGEGPNTFDMIAALEEWVEQAKAPDRIVASHATGGRVDRTRPLCPFPQVAVYAGAGSTDDAASFVCRRPVAPTAVAQRPGAAATPEALLDKMTGHWVLTGTIGRKPTTHDVDVDWILKREYIRIHEVSREKDAAGGPEYEAWIHIVWDATKSEYAVLWLDNTAAFTFAAEGIGHAKPDGDRIPMQFKDPDGSGVHTTFSYDRTKDTWSWTIDNVDKTGKMSSFANVILTRKK